MECVEATRALKSSFLSQMTNSEVLSNDDLWCFTRTGTVSEDFPVEDLLNLDGDFFEDDEVKHEEVMKFSSSGSDSLSSTDEFDGFSAGGGGLSVPFEDLENLEWLSQFVDSEPSLCGLTADVGVRPLAEVNRPAKQLPCFSFKVRKARSKRQRSSGSQWSTEDSTVTAESMSSYGSSTLCPFVEKPPPPAKKLKRKAEAESGFISGRRCTHCHVQKTPQWRSGPLGPKTLCNACGVRFKSGRLFPEYRPACSPTFSQQMHSNSHRKVLEMRRKKETETIAEEPIGLVSN